MLKKQDTGLRGYICRPREKKCVGVQKRDDCLFVYLPGHSSSFLVRQFTTSMEEQKAVGGAEEECSEMYHREDLSCNCPICKTREVRVEFNPDPKWRSPPDRYKRQKGVLIELHAHPRDQFVLFVDHEHKYYLYDHVSDTWNQFPTSVSGVYHNFFPEFPSFFVSKNIANGKRSRTPGDRYFGMVTQKQVLDTWEQARNDGTRLHEAIENYLNGERVETSHIPEFKQFLNLWRTVTTMTTSSHVKYRTSTGAWSVMNKRMLASMTGMKAFRSEWIVWAKDFNVSGTIDMTMIKPNGRIVILDWKRIPKLEFTADKMGLHLLQHEFDCNYVHYVYQLNLYRFLLEKEYGVKVDEMFLVPMHPEAEDFQLVHVERKPDALIRSMFETYHLYGHKPYVSKRKMAEDASLSSAVAKGKQSKKQVLVPGQRAIDSLLKKNKKETKQEVKSSEEEEVEEMLALETQMLAEQHGKRQEPDYEEPDDMDDDDNEVGNEQDGFDSKHGTGGGMSFFSRMHAPKSVPSKASKSLVYVNKDKQPETPSEASAAWFASIAASSSSSLLLPGKPTTAQASGKKKASTARVPVDTPVMFSGKNIPSSSSKKALSSSFPTHGSRSLVYLNAGGSKSQEVTTPSFPSTTTATTAIKADKKQRKPTTLLQTVVRDLYATE